METVGFSLKTVDKYLFLLLIINIEHENLCGKLNQSYKFGSIDDTEKYTTRYLNRSSS